MIAASLSMMATAIFFLPLYIIYSLVAEDIGAPRLTAKTDGLVMLGLTALMGGGIVGLGAGLLRLTL